MCVCVCVCVLVRRGCCALASTGCITNCTIQRQLASWSAENSLEKPQMKLHLRGNTLQGWAAIFQDAVQALNQKFPLDSLSPGCMVWEAGGGNRQFYLLQLPVFHWGTSCSCVYLCTSELCMVSCPSPVVGAVFPQRTQQGYSFAANCGCNGLLQTLVSRPTRQDPDELKEVKLLLHSGSRLTMGGTRVIH